MQQNRGVSVEKWNPISFFAMWSDPCSRPTMYGMWIRLLQTLKCNKQYNYMLTMTFSHLKIISFSELGRPHICPISPHQARLWSVSHWAEPYEVCSHHETGPPQSSWLNSDPKIVCLQPPLIQWPCRERRNHWKHLHCVVKYCGRIQWLYNLIRHPLNLIVQNSKISDNTWWVGGHDNHRVIISCAITIAITSILSTWNKWIKWLSNIIRKQVNLICEKWLNKWL